MQADLSRWVVEQSRIEWPTMEQQLAHREWVELYVQQCEKLIFNNQKEWADMEAVLLKQFVAEEAQFFEEEARAGGGAGGAGGGGGAGAGGGAGGPS